MKTLYLRHDYREATDGLDGQFADRSHVRQTLDEDTKLVAPDGTITAILLCDVIPPARHKRAFELCQIIHELPSNRPTAVGSPSLPRLKSDGTVGNRRGVPKPVLKVLKAQGAGHAMLGYVDATPDQPCHKTPLTVRYPELLDANRPLVEIVDARYRQHAPTVYARQRAETEKAPQWRLWDTAFSTVYVTKNFRSAYHSDTGNLPGVLSALMPAGKFTGGELVLARWRIAIAFKPGDVLLFDPQQLHGNLPFKGQRLSAAFFCARRIADCGK